MRETDAVHGGLPLASLREQCPDELRAAVFAHPVVEWQRVRDFQLVSLRQVGQALLQSLIAARADDALYVTMELTELPLLLPTKTMRTSVHNVGAEGFTQ